MRISIKSIETSGLRCVDSKIDFTDRREKTPVNLVQAPNGTAKTTIIDLIIGVLSKSAKKWTKSEIKEFRKKKVTPLPSKGFFKLELGIQKFESDEPSSLILQLDFDFENNTIHDTSYDDSGYKNFWSYPPEMLPYLDDTCVGLFIFKGDKTDEILTRGSGDAVTPVKSYFGLSSLEQLEKDIKKSFRDKLNIRGHDTVEAKENKNTKHLKIWEARKDELDNLLKLYEKQKIELDTELKAIEKDHEEELRKHHLIDEQKKIKSNLDLNAADISKKTNEIMTLLRDPFSFSEDINDNFVSLKNTLDDHELPGTSRSFFDRWLSNSDKCFCGEHLSESKKIHFKDTISSYLTDDDISIVESIKNEAVENQIAPQKKALDKLFDELNDLFNEKKLFEIEQKKLEAKLASIAGAETKEIIQRHKDLQAKITTNDSNIQRLTFFDKDLSKFSLDRPEACLSYNICEAIVDQLYEVQSELEGFSKLARGRSTLLWVLQRTLTDSLKSIQKELVESSNEKLGKFTNGAIEVINIDKNLQIGTNGHEQAQGSGAQNALSIYAFTTSILERAQVHFPLIVDHPVTALDGLARISLGEKISDISHQFIGFLIDTEREEFLPTLEKSGDLHYISLFRNSSITEPFRDDLNQGEIDTFDGESKDFGFVSYRKEFFHKHRMGTLK